MRKIFLILSLFIFSCDEPVVDCAGVEGGSASLDDCGVCSGDNSTCLDACGVVNGDGYTEYGYWCEDVNVLQDIIDSNPSMEGMIPSQIDQEWKYGRLFELGLHDIKIIVLPASITTLVVESLHFINTEMESFPDIILDLISLTYLQISNNLFTSIPEEISNLVNLEQLSLHSNNLSSIPSTICNFPNISYIELSWNELCNEYYDDCIEYFGDQDQSNCCEGPNGEPNWTQCP